MASYLSKVPDFGTYQPEVNAELYGKLLVKKEAEYQAGVQKIDSTLDYVAALPVASERERKYLQEKVDKITSEINRNVNVDWSNLSVQKLTASHIKDVAKDPNVQMAVYNASKLKNGMKTLQEDEDTSEGKSILNKQAYLDEYNNWLQNGELGKAFTGEYNKFLDPVDDFVKYYKDKKPNQKIEVKYAGYQYDEQGNIKRGTDGKPIINAQLATQEWDATTLKYKEIRPDEVERDFENFVGMNPQYQKQLEINSKYKYKSLDAGKTVEMLDSEIEKNIYNKKQAIQSITLELGTMKADNKERLQRMKLLENLKTEVDNLSSQITPEAKMQKIQALQANPELVQSFREQLYKHDLSNSLVSRFSSREDIDIGFHGAGPTEKAKNLFDEKYKAETIRLAQNKDSREKRKADREDAAAAAKQKKELEKQNDPYGAMTLPGSTDKLKTGDWELFEDGKNEMAFKLTNYKNTYLSDSYSQMFPDKFKMNPYTFKLEPKPEFQKELDEMYEINKQKYLNGEYLSKEDMNHFKQVVEDEKLYNVTQQKISQAKAALKEEQVKYNKDPNYVKAKKDYIEEYNRWMPEDSQRCINAVYVFDKLTKAYGKKGLTKEVSEAGQKLAKTYGFNSFKEVEDIIYDAGYDPRFPDISYKRLISTYRDYQSKLEEKDNVFLNNYVKASNFIVNPKFIPLSNIDPRTGKKMTEKEMNNLVRPYVERAGGTITVDQRSIGSVYDPTTGKFSIAVQEANDDMKFYEITPNEASSLKLKPVGSEDYLDKILRLNTLPSGESSNTYSSDPETSHTFMDAIPLGIVEGSEVRYHVKKVQGQYYLEYWTKDPNAPKDDPGFIVKNKTTRIPLTVQSNSLQDIKIAISNYLETGSTATPGRYYSETSQQSEQEQETE